MGRAKKFNDRHAEALVRRQKQGAAASHRENDRYMADFRDAYGLAAPAEPAGGLRGGAACAFSRARVASWGNREVDAAAADAFRRGPRDPRGALVDCSDRPLLAMSVSDDGADVVAGGADHAAHGVDVARAGAKPQRQYHGKARGHHEWVTGVAHCGGRSVATCGADGRLCLWRSPHACEELVTADGAASLSVLLADAARPQLLLAAGYDGTARLFDVGGRRAREAGRLAPAAAPAARRSSAPPGTGRPAASATATAACSSTTCDLLADAAPPAPGGAENFTSPRLRHTGRFPRRPHEEAGHCVALCAVGDRLVSGHQDGRVRGWDARDRDDRPAWTAPAHRGRAGAGAASCVAALADDALVATCGADRRVCVVDPRAPDAPVHAFREHRDFPYCLATLGGDLIFTGAGDGALLCRDRRGTQPPARCRRGRDAAGLLAMAFGRSRETGGERLTRFPRRPRRARRGQLRVGPRRGPERRALRRRAAGPARRRGRRRRARCRRRFDLLCFAEPAARPPPRAVAPSVSARTRRRRVGEIYTRIGTTRPPPSSGV